MGAADDDTLQFYRRNAEAYAGWAKAPSARLKSFLALLPPAGAILELGCGAGNHAAEMLARGFVLRATDGSHEMAEIASRRLNHPVATMRFDELDECEAFDGVWANACLLHVPRQELVQILALIWLALRPAGYFYASYKTGDADGRDTLNRYYNYPSPDWLRATYADAGSWSSFSIETGEVTGFDGKRAAMLFVTARKNPSG